MTSFTLNINLPGYEVEQLCGYDNKDEFSDALIAARLFNGEYTDSDGEPTMDVDLLERIQFITDATKPECRRLRVNCVMTTTSTMLKHSMMLMPMLLIVGTGKLSSLSSGLLDVMCQEIDRMICVDWEGTYNRNLRYDFFEVNTPKGVILFHNH